MIWVQKRQTDSRTDVRTIYHSVTALCRASCRKNRALKTNCWRSRHRIASAPAAWSSILVTCIGTGSQQVWTFTPSADCTLLLLLPLQDVQHPCALRSEWCRISEHVTCKSLDLVEVYRFRRWNGVKGGFPFLQQQTVDSSKTAEFRALRLHPSWDNSQRTCPLWAAKRVFHQSISAR